MSLDIKILIMVLVAFLGGILVGLSYHASRSHRQAEELRQARELADFWREHCNNWHQIAVEAGAGQRKRVQRIMVPDPPQTEIVAAGKVGLKVWRN